MTMLGKTLPPGSSRPRTLAGLHPNAAIRRNAPPEQQRMSNSLSVGISSAACWK